MSKKKEMTKEEIGSVLVRHNSFNVFEGFLNIAPSLEDKAYCYALGYAYDCSDNLYGLKNKVRKAFTSTRCGREALMTQEEREFLEALPEKIRVYRGMTKKEQKSQDFGIGWTLDRKVAEFFAHEYNRNLSTNHLEKTVHEMVIDKSDVVAFLNDRKESTIIYVHKKRKKHPSKNRVPKNLKSGIADSSRTDTLFPDDLFDVELYKEAGRDVISVKDIAVKKNEDAKVDVMIDLDFYVSLRISYFPGEADREGEFYRFLAETQKNFHPSRINKTLKKILGLPSEYRKLKEHVLLSETSFLDCTITDWDVFVRFEKRIAFSDYKL